MMVNCKFPLKNLRDQMEITKIVNVLGFQRLLAKLKGTKSSLFKEFENHFSYLLFYILENFEFVVPKLLNSQISKFKVQCPFGYSLISLAISKNTFLQLSKAGARKKKFFICFNQSFKEEELEKISQLPCCKGVTFASSESHHQIRLGLKLNGILKNET